MFALKESHFYAHFRKIFERKPKQTKSLQIYFNELSKNMLIIGWKIFLKKMKKVGFIAHFYYFK